MKAGKPPEAATKRYPGGPDSRALPKHRNWASEADISHRVRR
jgi:hypothetical protein